MYDGLQKIEKVIDYIEENILNDINCELLAAEMNLSVYEFRRIFSFIVGCPISQYIRFRRLSLAACELLKNESVNMCVLSQKYGYSTQSAFIKAFNTFHGVSPTAYLKGKTDLNFFTRMTFEMAVTGRENVSFNIQKYKPFYISGFSKTVETVDNSGKNPLSLFDVSKINPKTNEHDFYAAYKIYDGRYWCLVGQKSSQKNEGKDNLLIPEVKYACFKLLNAETEFINQKYNEITNEILPSARLSADSSLPFICYYPKDKAKSGFALEIRIPLL